MAQHRQLYELWKKAGLIKGKKTQESSRAFKAKVAALKAKTDKSSNEILFLGEKPKANNGANPELGIKGSGTRQSHKDT